MLLRPVYTQNLFATRTAILTKKHTDQPNTPSTRLEGTTEVTSEEQHMKEITESLRIFLDTAPKIVADAVVQQVKEQLKPLLNSFHVAAEQLNASVLQLSSLQRETEQREKMTHGGQPPPQPWMTQAPAFIPLGEPMVTPPPGYKYVAILDPAGHKLEPIQTHG